ncbi:hypothetical protein [Bifidobacterium italicum]|uniref:hypothetical protein n=1 Tax=Bifidobacterium italicum TaxID=1960968 RepID=UPI0010544E9B|nr:hypothetical protein [Bifidobacterium italicum]
MNTQTRIIAVLALITHSSLSTRRHARMRTPSPCAESQVLRHSCVAIRIAGHFEAPGRKDNPYIISLYAAGGNVVFRITDTPKNTVPGSSHQYGRSSGLARHQQQLERIGGTVTISDDHNLFSATYTLPTCAPSDFSRGKR